MVHVFSWKRTVEGLQKPEVNDLFWAFLISFANKELATAGSQQHPLIHFCIMSALHLINLTLSQISISALFCCIYL